MKKALVLSGGGAKGAYEIGAYKALKKLGFKFDIMCGTSIGALNASCLIANGYLKTKRMWKKLNNSALFDDSYAEKGITTSLLKDVFNNKGLLSFDKAELFIKSHISESKVRRSKIDLGIVTYSLTSRTPKMLVKKDIPSGKLLDYVIASATCFPAVSLKKIDNDNYIDGGYYDNLPINLAIEMGATDIVAIDLSSVSSNKKIKNNNVHVDTITCSDKKMFVLDFTYDYSKKLFSLGYNDCLKYYDKLDGSYFTFKYGDLNKNYQSIYKSYINVLGSTILINNKGQLVDDLYKIKKFEVLFTDIKQRRSIKTVIDESLEYLGKLFELDNTKIYSIKEYNKLLINSIPKLEDKKLDSKLKGKMLVSYMYNRYFSVSGKSKLTREFYNLACVFKKDFLAAIYLITITDKSLGILKSQSYYEEVINWFKENQL